ncbi:GNAT family protein [Gallaecimonas sp. GXIMD4217]|uniref:GNAT family N-acetyltransferase n=1 Tax=Gallaecimonas sp. GXIMD4217 TaxID=3131927 RepID=UPI00311B1D7C
MKLRTDRLELTQITLQDWPLFLALHQDQEVMAHVRDPMSEAEIRDHFERRLPPWQQGRDQWLSLVMTERESGRPVGITGFRCDWAPNCQAELGFLLLPEHQGQGYGFESLEALLDFAFDRCGYHKLTATVTSGNLASAALLEKAGFQREGCLREHYRLHGRWHDDWLYGLLAADRAGLGQQAG